MKEIFNVTYTIPFDKLWLSLRKSRLGKSSELIYYWYDEPDSCLIKLNSEYNNELINLIKQKYISLKKFFTKFAIDIDINLRMLKCSSITVRNLKKILNGLNLSYNVCERHIVAIGSRYPLNVAFPIKLNNLESALLVAAFMSDGHNEDQHPHYTNNSAFLNHKILSTALKLVPNLPWETRNDKIRFHPFLGRILQKLGVPYGNKSMINPIVPSFIWSNIAYMKIYLTQVFDDEGHATTKESRKMVLGRSSVVNNLPKDFVDSLPHGKRIMFNQLPDNVKELIIKQPPMLLIGEYFLLKKLGIERKMRCRGIYKYQNNNVSADWVIELYGKENMRKFQETIGFSEPSKVKQMGLYLNGNKK